MDRNPPFRYMAISDQTVCPEPIPDRVQKLFELGVPCIQLRDKRASDRTRANWIDQLPDGLKTNLLVNGRADFSRFYNLAGVHAPSNGLSIKSLRQLTAKRSIVGRSTHTREEVIKAEHLGADYVTFGPVYPTQSKPNLTPGDIPGVRKLKEVCKLVSIPVFALGGITTPSRVKECLESGAYGVAGIGALFGSPSPEDHWQAIQPIIEDGNS